MFTLDFIMVCFLLSNKYSKFRMQMTQNAQNITKNKLYSALFCAFCVICVLKKLQTFQKRRYILLNPFLQRIRVGFDEFFADDVFV